MKPKKTILEKFAEAKANLRRLEDELQGKIDEGLYAVVNSSGELVRITGFDGDETHYLRTETIEGKYRGYVSAEDLEVVTTREQARAALLTGIESQIDALFGDLSEASDD